MRLTAHKEAGSRDRHRLPYAAFETAGAENASKMYMLDNAAQQGKNVHLQPPAAMAAARGDGFGVCWPTIPFLFSLLMSLLGTMSIQQQL